MRSAGWGQRLIPPPKGGLSGSLDISNAWIETLGLCFSPSHEAAVLKAEKDFRERRFVVARSA